MADRVRTLSRAHLFALGSLGTIAAITAGWWALALWPAPADAPAWLARTRAVCFGVRDSGLPDPAGWAVLIGQPVSMLGVLLFGWWRTTTESLRIVARSGNGRIILTAGILFLATGAGATSVRVAGARADASPPLDGPARPAAELPRLHRPAPDLVLVDHRGDAFDLDQLRGRTVLLTFAFAHCETICPVLVREVRAARTLATAAGQDSPAVVVVTVDPWRDTPARIPSIARRWELGEDEWLLSGSVASVSAALEAWQVPTTRDTLTGEVTHPALVYVIDPRGRIAFATTGGGQHAAELLARAR